MFGVQLLLIIVLGVLLLLLYQNQLNLAKARDSYFNSYILADELRQSSDDLTRMARAYVATGNPEFEREYWAILDVRNGKIPRPLNYNRIYWDFVAATGQKPRGDGEAVALRDLMVQEGFTEAELAKLNLAQKNSDDLVQTEMIAMNAVKGLFVDEQGNFTVQGAPDRELAGRLMNDEKYYQIKAEIMRPIDDFYQMFQGRTEQAVAKYLGLSYVLFYCVLGLVLIIVLSFAVSFLAIRHQIVAHDKTELELNELKKNLESRVEERTLELDRSKTELNKTLEESERVNKLMVGRELKMVELKKEIADLKEKYENKK